MSRTIKMTIKMKGKHVLISRKGGTAGLLPHPANLILSLRATEAGAGKGHSCDVCALEKVDLAFRAEAPTPFQSSG